MSAQDVPPPFTLFRMISGFCVSRAIHVMARIGIADILGNGAADAEELAKRTETRRLPTHRRAGLDVRRRTAF